MKECFGKKVLIVKVAQNGPLASPSQKIDQVDSKIKSRVKKISVTRDQNSIFFLKVDPISFFGLNLIDPWSS